jgi:hypothetical protein
MEKEHSVIVCAMQDLDLREDNIFVLYYRLCERQVFINKFVFNLLSSQTEIRQSGQNERSLCPLSARPSQSLACETLLLPMTPQ